MALTMSAYEERSDIAIVNRVQCAALTETIRDLIHASQPVDSFCLARFPEALQLHGLIHLVAICDRLNWDFVLGPFARALWEATDGIDPGRLRRMREEDFRQLFASYWRQGDSLDVGRRLAALQKVGNYVARESAVNRLSQYRQIGGPQGALAHVATWPIYEDDPVRKKTNALFHEIVRRNLIRFEDPNALEPAVDYHLLRLYLRTGRVLVTDRDIVSRLRAREPVRIEVLTQLRQAVAAAMKYTAALVGESVSVLNDVEWAFARKACRRDRVACATGTCPLGGICLSTGEPVNVMLTEPTSRHGLY